MIVQLHKQPTGLSSLLEIPTSFFKWVEWSDEFDESLFPIWFNEVFGSTNNRQNGLYQKFNNLFNSYKRIEDPVRRAEIINAYTDGIQIENLCNGIADIKAVPIAKFDEISKELKAVLMHLWNNSLQDSGFERNIAKTTVKKFVANFMSEHKTQICPFCGLEGYMYLDGQSRPALDHWLSKDDFPYSSVNFDNLVPIGDKCNASPAKGTKNVLTITNSNRVFYPFTRHDGIKVNIKWNQKTKLLSAKDVVFEIEVKPLNNTQKDLFDSWDALFNITTNYESYLVGNLLNNWKGIYKEFICGNIMLNPAQNIKELIINLKHWRGSFQPNITPGYLIYHAFIDRLLIMPKAYLYGLCEYFKNS